jgi:hypothetical protein
LSCVPSSLAGIYDSILLRISRFTQTHQDLAKTALLWIAAAQQPLLVEELIEACTVRLEAGGQVHEGLRLSPADIVLLLRHLVTVEKAETATDLPSTAVSIKDRLVFAHFSVGEYLTTAQCISPKLRQGFAIDLEQARLHVASCCIAYLLRTNTQDKRQDEYPLREYAWDHWAMYAVASKTDTATEMSERAQDFYQKVAFGGGSGYGSIGYNMPEELQEITWWTDSKRAVLDCLRSPYFFEEYDARELKLGSGIETQIDEVRLLHIIPSRTAFAGVRLSTMHTPLETLQEYEVVFFFYELQDDSNYGSFLGEKPGHVWLNGHPRPVKRREEAALRAMQESSLHSRPFWSDVISITRWNSATDSIQKCDQVALRSKTLASARSIIVYLEDASEDEVWALEIIRLTDQPLEKRSDDTFNDLAKLLRSRLSTDPFTCLASLFQRSRWLEFPRLQEAISDKGRLTFRYGIHYSLPFERLQNFVSLAGHAFGLINAASSGTTYDPAVLMDTDHWDDVLGVVQIRAQLQGNLGTKPRNVIQLLYTSRHCKLRHMTDRLCPLEALMPPGTDLLTDAREAYMVFCSYTLLFMNNLDLFTIYATPFNLSKLRVPTWAEIHRNSTTVENTRPLLYQELITGADGPFCAGGREFREEPTIDRSKERLHLKGFRIDNIVMHDNPSRFCCDQALLDRKGYGKFKKGRRWFRTAGGLAVLGPEKSPAGCLLTILIGGKTPYLLKHDRMEPSHFHLIGEWYVNSQSFRDTRYRALISLATWKV